jgi:hypothetical protein
MVERVPFTASSLRGNGEEVKGGVEMKPVLPIGNR